MIRRGLAEYTGHGGRALVPDFLALLAEAHGRAGRAAAGLDLLADALDRVERTERRWIEAELHRLRGELLLALPEPDQAEAEACFRRALAVAREQGARTVGAARRDEPRPAVARPGQAGRGARPARPRLRLVHRGLRHARPAGGEGAARCAPAVMRSRAWDSTSTTKPPPPIQPAVGQFHHGSHAWKDRLKCPTMLLSRWAE